MPDRQPPEDVLPLTIVRLDGAQCVVLRIRGASDETMAAVGTVLASPLPLTPNRATGGNLWLAPGEWLLTSVSEDGLSRLVTTLAGTTFHLADVTHGRSVFAMSGQHARDLIARGCSLDLHPRVFEAGSCAQSLFAQVPTLLHLVSEDLFHLYIDASHEAYLLAWLKQVSRVFPSVEIP